MGWYLDGEIYIGTKLMQEHWHRTGVAKPLPGGKKVPAKTFSIAV